MVVSTPGMIAAVSVAGGIPLVMSRDQPSIIGNIQAADAVAAIQKQLNGLGDYEQFREGAFYQALSQTVDDPNTVADFTDSDGDGNITELVPAFQQFWDVRLKAFKAQAQAEHASRPSVSAFLQNTLYPLKETVKKMLVELHRQEIECGCAGGGAEGRMVELARALDRDGYALSFWAAGPDTGGWLRWLACGGQCSAPPPAGHDEMDQAHLRYGNFLEVACGLLDPNGKDDTCWDLGATPAPYVPPLTPGDNGEEPNNAPGAWKYWLPWLYDPKTDGDFYDVLNVMTNGEGGTPDQTLDADGNPTWGTCGRSGFLGVCGWGDEIKGILHLQLPRCQLTYGRHAIQTTMLAEPVTNSCSAGPQLHSCPWTRVGGSGDGTYFSNPSCRIYTDSGGGQPGQAGDDQFQLIKQINAARAFVFGGGSNPDDYALTEYIREEHFGSDACKPSMNIRVQSLGLRNDALEYAFDYDCPTDPANQGSASGRADRIGAADLTIPRITANVWGEFERVVTDFKDTVDQVTADHNGKFATIDQDTLGEPRQAMSAIWERAQEINPLLVELKRFAEAMDQGNKTGAGSVTYRWTDNRGPHAVTVETGPFKVANLDHFKTGNWLKGKLWQRIHDYADDGSKTWIQVTRQEPANINTGFWTWNPFGGTITKTSRVSYSYDQVGIKDRK